MFFNDSKFRGKCYGSFVLKSWGSSTSSSSLFFLQKSFNSFLLEVPSKSTSTYEMRINFRYLNHEERGSSRRIDVMDPQAISR